MSALLKTTKTATTLQSDMHSGHGTEMFSAGAAPCLDGVQTQMFSSGSAPSKATAQFDGVLTDMFSSGS